MVGRPGGGDAAQVVDAVLELPPRAKAAHPRQKAGANQLGAADQAAQQAAEQAPNAGPEAGRALYEACLARGMDLSKTAVSAFNSITLVFRSLVDMPPDMHVDTVRYSSRHTNQAGGA